MHRKLLSLLVVAAAIASPAFAVDQVGAAAGSVTQADVGRFTRDQNGDPIGSLLPPMAPLPQGAVIVQPRAHQFSPPYGRPDVSDDKARQLDELYVAIMRRAHEGCLFAGRVNDAASGC